MTEVWRPIPGFSDYQASTDGRVWSNARVKVRSNGRPYTVHGRVLSQFPARDGYPQVRLVADDGRFVSRKVHLLVLMTFVGPCPEDMEACHGDDDHMNAKLSNLRWDTRSSNNLDRGGRYVRGDGRTCNERSSDRRRVFRERLSDDK
jgi:hypothetical protein